MKEMHIGASHEQPPVGAETSEMAPLPEVEFLQNVGKAVSGVMDMAVSGVESAENFLYDCACEASTKNWGWFDWVLDIPRGYCGEEEGSPFKYLGAVGKGIQEFATNIVKGTLNLTGHPVETAKGIGYAVMHREEVGNALKEHYWGSNTTITQKVAGVTEAICDVAFLAYGGKKLYDILSKWLKAKKVAKMAETGEIAGEVAKAGEAGAEVAEDAAKAGGKGKVKIESGKTNKYKLTEKLRKHIEEVDLAVPRKRGIGGAHNKNNFLKNDVKIVKTTPNKNIKGVEIIEYQMPKLDKTGTPIPGEYQGGNPKVKTVYDPNVISTNEYLERGLQAANNASKNYTDGILPREWVGVDNQGVSWRGYCENGEITSMYPE